MSDRYYYIKAKRRVKRKKAFYSNLITWFIVSCFLVFINVFTSPFYFWAAFPIAAWGMGVLFQGLSVLNAPGMSREWEEEEIMREMNRMKYREDADDYESEKVERLELKQIERVTERYRDSDFV